MIEILLGLCLIFLLMSFVVFLYCAKEIRKYNEELIQKTNKLEKQRADALKCINDFCCTYEYISTDGKAIANNYYELMCILDK